MIKLRRVYDPPEGSDGKRILVDRLWPRGLSKEKARVDDWVKEVAPSEELRKWFGHDPGKWSEFHARYLDELQSHPEEMARLRELTADRDATLVYAAGDRERNNAVVVKEVLEAEERR